MQTRSSAARSQRRFTTGCEPRRDVPSANPAVRLRNEVQTDGRPLANGGSAVGADGTDPGVVTGRFLTAISTVVRVRAVKLYRLRIQPLPHVPALPCLDHEAMLHEGIAPHVAAYVEDLERAELHEVVLIPSRRRVEIDVASTWQEHTEDGQQQLIAALREHVPEIGRAHV